MFSLAGRRLAVVLRQHRERVLRAQDPGAGAPPGPPDQPAQGRHPQPPAGPGKGIPLKPRSTSLEGGPIRYDVKGWRYVVFANCIKIKRRLSRTALKRHQAIQVSQLKVGSLNHQLVHVTFNPSEYCIFTFLSSKVDFYRVFSNVFSNVNHIGKGVPRTQHNGLRSAVWLSH
jgi:hypothetical protein